MDKACAVGSGKTVVEPKVKPAKGHNGPVNPQPDVMESWSMHNGRQKPKPMAVKDAQESGNKQAALKALHGLTHGESRKGKK
jgi:hypothetical protein